MPDFNRHTDVTFVFYDKKIPTDRLWANEVAVKAYRRRKTFRKAGQRHFHYLYSLLTSQHLSGVDTRRSECP